MDSTKKVSHCETNEQQELIDQHAIWSDRYLFKRVLDSLELATKLELCIAGGAVRDLIHGKQFKDLDIEVLNFEPIYSHSLVQERFELIEAALTHLYGVTEVQTFNEYEGHSLDARIDFVIKFKYLGCDCDLILRDTHPTTPEELVAMYDMNLNQVVFHQGRVKVIKPIVDGMIEPTGKLISLERLQRMMKKYPEYNFTKMINYLEPHNPLPVNKMPSPCVDPCDMQAVSHHNPSPCAVD